MRLRAVIKTRSPRLLAFNGKTAAARYFNVRPRRSIMGVNRTDRANGHLCLLFNVAGNGHWSCEAWEELARAVAALRLRVRA